MVVGIIGLGLIGGSLAISLKQRGFATKIIGVDKNEAHLEEANELGFVDEACELNEILNKTDLVLLAIPVDAARQLLPFLLDQAKDGQTIIDMGSTKEGICKVADAHHNRKNFVASHPIAGTENAGPSSAMDGLYDHKITIICDEEKSHPNSIELCNKLYDVLKMRVLKMNAQEHDRHIAYVSHLSHITSFVLGQTVLEIEKEEKHIFNMAGSGFASTVRLAKSSPEMWAPIFEQNQEHLSTALDAYIKNLQEFKRKIDEGKKEDLHDLMSEVNDIRRVLKGI
ncbi:MAG: prephenate dehydrogenase [Flavobacteriales bacterium]|nr:prephenate dehydrogenase [Flavobacteriales bacterium]|tara:strand:- start:51052 stop:51900 length:849 start_codon:yes stop_codon:yes gene_type:complete